MKLSLFISICLLSAAYARSLTNTTKDLGKDDQDIVKPINIQLELKLDKDGRGYSGDLEKGIVKQTDSQKVVNKQTNKNNAGDRKTTIINDVKVIVNDGMSKLNGPGQNSTSLTLDGDELRKIEIIITINNNVLFT